MNTQFKIFSLATFSLYSILNAIIYQWTFWDIFDVNIMQFMSINDLLPSIAFSVALPIAILGVYATVMSFLLQTKLISNFLDSFITHKQKNITSTEILISKNLNAEIILAPKPTRRSLSINKVSLFFALTIICLSGYLLYISPKNGLKIVIALGISFSIKHLVMKSGEFRESLGNLSLPIMVVVCSMPHVMCVSAMSNAYDILKTDDNYLVKSDSLCKKEDKSEKFRYIANVGDKAFAYSLTDKSICIFKYDKLSLIKESSFVDDTHDTLTPLPLNRA
ncbi:hypothetical protein [Pantoea agglomerans]|uniref:hypothetical protein n=1 Tax=Enterobacter agglomerans TaxID=549 RepID=UPI002F91EE6C